MTVGKMTTGFFPPEDKRQCYHCGDTNHGVKVSISRVLFVGNVKSAVTLLGLVGVASQVNKRHMQVHVVTNIRNCATFQNCHMVPKMNPPP